MTHEADVMVDDSALSRFNDLVREAYKAQEAFDEWDEGATRIKTTGSNIKRWCTLDEVKAEWRKANEELIEHVLDHGPMILRWPK